MPRPFGRRETSPVGAHPLQASTEAAETAFAFLSQLGFVLDERWITGGESFRDGWRLSYSSSQVQVVVQYLDSQFEVSFTRSATTVTYLTIDQELFDRRSGYHGDMFPPEKVGNALDKISADVRAHYGRILSGDDAEWTRIARIHGLPRASRIREPAKDLRCL
jgi:hypothetical protein